MLKINETKINIFLDKNINIENNIFPKIDIRYELFEYLFSYVDFLFCEN